MAPADRAVAQCTQGGILRGNPQIMASCAGSTRASARWREMAGSSPAMTYQTDYDSQAVNYSAAIDRSPSQAEKLAKARAV